MKDWYSNFLTPWDNDKGIINSYITMLQWLLRLPYHYMQNIYICWYQNVAGRLLFCA